MWYYNGEIFDESLVEKYFGFVYIITNNITGKKYVGKKAFWFTKTKTIKGKKKRQKIPSDWKDYWSSSEELKEDVKSLGQNNFKREIVRLCLTKGTASYFEAKLQFLYEVLEKPEQWYNAYIQCRIHRSHLKL